MRVLIVEDEPYLAEAIRDGLRLEAIAADIAGDGDTALELLSINVYDIAVLDRDIPGPSGDEVAKRIVATGAACRSSCSPPPTGSTTRLRGSSSEPTTT
jgi:two-component system, OmpR family, response regulator VanR